VHGAHQEVTGATDAVAGEYPSRTIRAVGSGRKTEHEHTCARVAKARDRPAPIDVVTIRGTLLARDSRAVGAKALASRARNNVLMNVAERSSFHFVRRVSTGTVTTRYWR
jgi:hypothetical protein